MDRQRPQLGGLLFGALGATTIAVYAGLMASAPQHDAVAAAANALAITAPVGVGIYALREGYDRRFAWLLVLVGVLAVPILLQASEDDVLYSAGRVCDWIHELALVALVLVFPSGRLETKPARLLFGASVLTVAVLYLPTALLVEQFPVPSPWRACDVDCPANAFMLVGAEPPVVAALVVPLREALTTGLFIGVAAVLGARIARGSRLMRRMLAPVLAVAILRMGAAVVFMVVRAVAPSSPAMQVIGLVAVFAVPLLAAAFLVGMLRSRAFTRTVSDRLTTGVLRRPTAAELPALIGEAVDDPEIEVAYWVRARAAWIDASGRSVRMPDGHTRRAVTEIPVRGERLVAVIHDAALADEVATMQVVTGVALLVLENQRLDTELGAALLALQRSRSRAITAADAERRRIERDLHDGAQQQLVAVRIKLGLALEELQRDPDAGAHLLREIETNVGDALEEVRSLAHGVYPHLLAARGLDDALRSAVQHSPLPATLDIQGVGRYSAEVEGAVYFCCLEAIQNAAKHAGSARSLTVTLHHDEQLHFEIRDDGDGFSINAVAGAGLDNMRDRIGAVGGKLAIDSVAGRGTRVWGTVPVPNSGGGRSAR